MKQIMTSLLFSILAAAPASAQWGWNPIDDWGFAAHREYHERDRLDWREGGDDCGYWTIDQWGRRVWEESDCD